MEKEKSDQQVSRYSSFRFSIVTKALAVCTAVGSIMIPVLILFLGNLDHLASAITAVSFVFLFAVMIVVVTEATMEKIFIGTVACVYRDSSRARQY
jgi:hypothetical protein